MNLEKFTERSREFIQAAQAAALAAEHQRILPQHLLKVILEDEQDFAKNLLKKIGVDSHKILVEIDLLLGKVPKIKSENSQCSLTRKLCVFWSKRKHLPKKMLINLYPWNGYCVP